MDAAGFELKSSETMTVTANTQTSAGLYRARFMRHESAGKVRLSFLPIVSMN